MRLTHCIAITATEAILLLPGCRRTPDVPWQIVLDNRSGAPCEVSVEAHPGAGANAPDIGVGEKRVLLSGREPITVESVQAVCARRERRLAAHAEVKQGETYRIVVSAAGALRGEVTRD